MKSATRDKVKGNQTFKKRHSRYLYLMESESYLKIGISCDPYKRLGRLNTYIPENNQRFVVVMFVDCHDGVAARLMEKSLHTKFKDHQVLTDFEGAKTECFSKEIKDQVIKELDNVYKYQPFDPFITCSPSDLKTFLKINNINLADVCKMIGKSFTDTSRTKVKLSISCILANLEISKQKPVVYNRNDVVNLASGGRFCELLINKLFSCDKIITNNHFKLPDEICVRYDVRVGKRLQGVYFRQSVRHLFLLMVYSYTNNLSDYFTRMVDSVVVQEDYAEIAEVNMNKAYEVVVGGVNCIVRKK